MTLSITSLLILTKELKYQDESNKSLNSASNNQTVLCARNYQSVLEAISVYGRPGNILEHDKAVVDLSALEWLVEIYMIGYPWIIQV
jgi:hypothetical protein